MPTGRVYAYGKRWMIDIDHGVDESGKRIRKRTISEATTKTKAKEELDRKLYRLNKEASGNEATSNECTLDAILELWKEHIAVTVSNTENRRRVYGNAVNAVNIFKGIGAYKVSEITPSNTSSVLSILSETLSNNTSNKHIYALKRAIKFGVKNRVVISNPLDDIEYLPEVQVKFRRAFTDEEVNILLEEATDTWRTFYLFAVSTGCRQDEIVHIRWSSIDFDNNTIRIEKTPDWKPKTKAGIRTIPMTNNLKKALLKAPRKAEYVFCTRSGTKRANNVLRHFKAAVRRMTPKVYPKWNKDKRDQQEAMLDFHALRYTLCTKLIRLGVNIKTVQAIMGHEDIQTTLNIYAQYCSEDGAVAMDKLPW